MAKGKAQSKNNAALRQKAQEIIFNGKKVKPVLFFDGERKYKYMAVQVDDNSGSMILGPDGMPLAWGSIAGGDNSTNTKQDAKA